MKHRKCTVSLCLIAKNEEANIAACLNSVRHIVDEMIVVDTGSEDGTIARALQEGAKVVVFPWQYNFAAARNYALDQATGQWILVLDADETLEYVAADAFTDLLKDDAEGYRLTIESCIGRGEDKICDQAVRLFRNRPQYRFYGVIHEQVAASIINFKQGQGIAEAPLKIIHRGYLAEVIREKNKHTRNIEVINRALAQHPADPLLHYSLGMEYLQQGRAAAGNTALLTALQYMTGAESYFSDVVAALAAGMQLSISQQGNRLNLPEIGITAETNRKWQFSLLQQGEDAVVLVLALLNILKQCGERQALLTAGEDYAQAIRQYSRADELSLTALAYLQAGAALINLYTQGTVICALAPVTINLEKIVCDDLEVITNILMPQQKL